MINFDAQIVAYGILLFVGLAVFSCFILAIKSAILIVKKVLGFD